MPADFYGPRASSYDAQKERVKLITDRQAKSPKRQKAMEAYKQAVKMTLSGEHDRAMPLTEMASALDPTFSDAMKLRSRLMQKKGYL